MSFIRSAVTVGSGTLLSRVLGFVRDILIAAMLGAGPLADAFFVSFRLPNLFRRLFAEGAFNSAFVPLFAGKLARDGAAEAQLFAEQSLSVLLAILFILTILAEIFMPKLMFLLAPGFTDDTQQFANVVLFGRIMFPYLLFVSLVALYGGILNSLMQFASAALTPVLFNCILIVALAVIIPVFGWPGETLSWAVAVAGVAQFLMLAAVANRSDMRLRLTLAASDAGCQTPAGADRSGGHFRRHRADQSVYRHDHRIAACGRGVLSVLCRQAIPGAA